MTTNKDKPPKYSLISWFIYDTGNTVFFAAVMGLVFPLWITTVMGGNDATVGFTLSAAMVIVLLISPILGSISDETGKRMRFLTFFTLIGVVATVLIGSFWMALSLVLFALAVIAIHTADIFYNSMLEEVSSTSNMGTVAGLGIGLGYIGAIIGVGIAILFVESQGHVIVMRILGGLMFVLMSPLLLLGRDTSSAGRKGQGTLSQVMGASLVRLKLAMKGLRTERVWARFLIARFWYMWAVLAASSFAVLYGVDTVGLSERHVQFILLLGIITGIPSAAVWGKLVDKYGAGNILKLAVGLQLVTLVAAVGIPLLGLPGVIWTGVGISSGIFVAGLYVAERPLVIKIAPPGRTGEYFGLNSMAGRLAAIAAPFAWGFIAVTLGLGQIAAVAWLIVCVVIAVILLLGLDFRSSNVKR